MEAQPIRDGDEKDAADPAMSVQSKDSEAQDTPYEPKLHPKPRNLREAPDRKKLVEMLVKTLLTLGGPHSKEEFDKLRMTCGSREHFETIKYEKLNELLGSICTRDGTNVAWILDMTDLFSKHDQAISQLKSLMDSLHSFGGGPSDLHENGNLARIILDVLNGCAGRRLEDVNSEATTPAMRASAAKEVKQVSFGSVEITTYEVDGPMSNEYDELDDECLTVLLPLKEWRVAVGHPHLRASCCDHAFVTTKKGTYAYAVDETDDEYKQELKEELRDGRGTTPSASSKCEKKKKKKPNAKSKRD